jgi:hypothetical protein
MAGCIGQAFVLWAEDYGGYFARDVEPDCGREQTAYDPGKGIVTEITGVIRHGERPHKVAAGRSDASPMGFWSARSSQSAFEGYDGIGAPPQLCAGPFDDLAGAGDLGLDAGGGDLAGGETQFLLFGVVRRAQAGPYVDDRLGATGGRTHIHVLCLAGRSK